MNNEYRLYAWRKCGCLSHALVVYHNTTADNVGRFYKTAHERKCDIQKLPLDVKPCPEWLCDQHRKPKLF